MSFINRTQNNINIANQFLSELCKGLSHGKGRYRKLSLEEAREMFLFAVLHRNYIDRDIHSSKERSDASIEAELIKRFCSMLCRDWIPLKIRDRYYVELHRQEKLRG